MRTTRERRDNLIQWLETRGGPLRGYVVTYGHLQPAIEDCNELEDRLAQAEALLRRWKLADEADDKGLLDTAEYDRLIQERDAFLSDGE